MMAMAYSPCDSSATSNHQKMKTYLRSNSEVPIAYPDNPQVYLEGKLLHLQMSVATLQMTTLLIFLRPLSSASAHAEPHLVLAVPARLVSLSTFLPAVLGKVHPLKQSLVLLCLTLTKGLSLLGAVSHCEALVVCSGMNWHSLCY